MPTRYTAIMKQHGDGWIGWIEEVPGVHGQACTKDQLKDTLRLRLHAALEYYRQAVLEAAGEGYEQEGLLL
jgi:predicted RNase H-like HicB family nuclease